MGPSRMGERVKSFVSSSATLAEGLDLMSKPVDAVVTPTSSWMKKRKLCKHV